MNGALPEGTPILCRNCGGGMVLHANSSISCQYCGARDVLPADQLGRVLEIKNRLALAEQRTAQVRGFDATFAHVFETPRAFLRVSGVYLAVGLMVLVTTGYSFVSSVLPALDKVSGADQAQLIAGSLMGPILAMGAGLSFGAALLTGRSHYRRKVRPLLIARRPSAPGAPFACRACGGALPPARDAEQTCPYCRTLNLVPKELHGGQAASLFHEAEAAKQQLLQAQGAMMGIAAKMRLTLILCGVATVALGYGLPILGVALMSR